MPPAGSPARIALDWKNSVFPERFVQGHIGVPETSGKQDIVPSAISFGDWPNAVKSNTPTFAGVDQGKKIDVIVGDGKGKILGVHRFDTWTQLSLLIQTMRISLTVIDSAPELRAAQAMVQRHPGRVMLADFSLTRADKKPYIHQPGSARVRIHRSSAMDWTRDLLLVDDVFPDLPEKERSELTRQLCASVRTIVEGADGIPRVVWSEGTTPDHLRMAHLYYCVAADLRVSRTARIGSKPEGL